MTEFTSKFIEEAREQLKKISPLPWKACSCGKCGQISNEKDCITIATRGDWGDDYPDIRRVSGSIEGKFETFMNQITYGHIPPETGNNNAQYIAEACTNYPEALDEIERLQKRIAELEQERRVCCTEDGIYPLKGDDVIFQLEDGKTHIGYYTENEGSVFISNNSSYAFWVEEEKIYWKLFKNLQESYEQQPTLPQPPKEGE